MWLFCSYFFFKQKTAYEMRISDWSSDVCSSDLLAMRGMDIGRKLEGKQDLARVVGHADDRALRVQRKEFGEIMNQVADGGCIADRHGKRSEEAEILNMTEPQAERWTIEPFGGERSEEHTSELQSLMRNSYA